MKLWLASTNPELVKSSFELGLFAGVLTNPTTLAGAVRPAVEIMGDLCAATPSPVFYQLKNTTVDDMKRQASGLLARGWTNMGIKVALTREGCHVLSWLRDQKIPLRLATAVPTTAQVLLATALDVPWITPAGSMLEKLGGPTKTTLLTEMQTVLERQRSATVLIPSLASPAEMQVLGLAGIPAGFIWDRDLSRFVDSDLVQRILGDFEAAWTKLEASNY